MRRPYEPSHEFIRECTRGRIVGINCHALHSFPILFVQCLFGHYGTFDHAGVLGFDQYMWHMQGAGLSYSWLGKYITAGATVHVLDFHKLIQPFVLDEDIIAGITHIKMMHRSDKYDWHELLTFGLINKVSGMTCGTLVGEYITVACKDAIAEGIIKAPTKFVPPNDILKYCTIVATFGKGGMK